MRRRRFLCLVPIVVLAAPPSPAAPTTIAASPSSLPPANLFSLSRSTTASCARHCFNDSHFLFNGTGSGATCADARANLTANMRSSANSFCAAHYVSVDGMLCLFSEEYPQPCTEVSPGVFQVPGAAIYSCSGFFCT
jgi:hypothetical protein